MEAELSDAASGLNELGLSYIDLVSENSKLQSNVDDLEDQLADAKSQIIDVKLELLKANSLLTSVSDLSTDPNSIPSKSASFHLSSSTAKIYFDGGYISDSFKWKYTNSNTIQINDDTIDEIEEAVEEAYKKGYEDGYEDGVETAQDLVD